MGAGATKGGLEKSVGLFLDDIMDDGSGLRFCDGKDNSEREYSDDGRNGFSLYGVEQYETNGAAYAGFAGSIALSLLGREYLLPFFPTL